MPAEEKTEKTRRNPSAELCATIPNNLIRTRPLIDVRFPPIADSSDCPHSADYGQKGYFLRAVGRIAAPT